MESIRMIRRSKHLSVASELDLCERQDKKSAVQEYYKEVCYLAVKHNVPFNKIEICPDHPVGEVVIFIDGVWQGYIDHWFYLEMDTGMDMHSYYANMNEFCEE